MKPVNPPLYTVKEIAAQLKRHPSYVYAMRRRGWRMIGGRQTLQSALHFLRRNPFPRGNSHENGHKGVKKTSMADKTGQKSLKTRHF